MGAVPWSCFMSRSPWLLNVEVIETMVPSKVLRLTGFAPGRRFLYVSVLPCIHFQFLELLLQNDRSALFFLKLLLSFQNLIVAFVHPEVQNSSASEYTSVFLYA